MERSRKGPGRMVNPAPTATKRGTGGHYAPQPTRILTLSVPAKENPGAKAGAVVADCHYRLLDLSKSQANKTAKAKQNLYRLEQPYKMEGVNARVEGDVIRLLLVTDADDFEIPAALFSASIRRK